MKKPDRAQLKQLAESLLFTMNDEQLDALEEEFDFLIKQFKALEAISTETVPPFFHINRAPLASLRNDSPTKTVNERLHCNGTFQEPYFIVKDKKGETSEGSDR